MDEPVRLYICYAEENKNALSKLEEHLGTLIRAGRIVPWHRGNLEPGVYTDQHIAAHLDQARIIITLVSASLFASDYYDSPEMQRAFQLHEKQKVRLIPVIVEPCAWEEDRYLGDLEPLPRGRKPARLDDRAWHGVATEINQIAVQMQSEQDQKESAPAAKSSRPRARSRKSARPEPQPLSSATLAAKVPAINRSRR